MFSDDSAWLFQADALIRSKLNIDPDTLSDPEWTHQLTMALWLEKRHIEQLSKLFRG